MIDGPWANDYDCLVPVFWARLTPFSVKTGLMAWKLLSIEA